MTDLSIEIRLLRQQLLAIRQRMVQDLDALDARLNVLAGPEAGFQIPDTWNGYLNGESNARTTRRSKKV